MSNAVAEVSRKPKLVISEFSCRFTLQFVMPLLRALYLCLKTRYHENTVLKYE